MTLHKIAQLGHPILRQKARLLTDEELAEPAMQTLIDDMIETMRDAQGAGLAAPQIHQSVQVCMVEMDPERNRRYPYCPHIPLTVLVNPRFTVLSTADERFENFEGCLSLPNLRGRVVREARIRLQAWDRRGQALDFIAEGLSAGTYQHELDHLNGVLFVDRVCDSRSLCTTEHFDRFEKERFVGEAQRLVARYGS